MKKHKSKKKLSAAENIYTNSTKQKNTNAEDIDTNSTEQKKIKRRSSLVNVVSRIKSKRSSKKPLAESSSPDASPATEDQNSSESADLAIIKLLDDTYARLYWDAAEREDCTDLNEFNQATATTLRYIVRHLKETTGEDAPEDITNKWIEFEKEIGHSVNSLNTTAIPTNPGDDEYCFLGDVAQQLDTTLEELRSNTDGFSEIDSASYQTASDIESDTEVNSHLAQTQTDSSSFFKKAATDDLDPKGDSDKAIPPLPIPT